MNLKNATLRKRSQTQDYVLEQTSNCLRPELCGSKGTEAKLRKGILGLKIVTFYIVIAAIVTGSHFCRYKVHFKERERMCAIEKLEMTLWGLFVCFGQKL